MAKVKFGLSNVHIAKRNVNESGAVSYETPKALKGAVELTLEPQGEQTEFFADNIKYYVVNTTNGYTGNLTVALVPDWFKKDFLGYIEDTDGNLVETNKVGGEFGLMFQVETDEGNQKYAIFNCTCGKPTQEYSTVESTNEPKTASLAITMSGDTSGNYQCYIAEISSFETLAVPQFSA